MGRLARNGTPSFWVTMTITYPPSMEKLAWARLTKFIMPSVMDSPTDMINKGSRKRCR